MILIAAASAVLALLFIFTAQRKSIWRFYAFIQSFDPFPNFLPLEPAAIFSVLTVTRTLDQLRKLFRHVVPLALIMQGCLYSLALLWSPDLRQGLTNVFTIITLLAAILLCFAAEADTRRDPLQLTMTAFAPFAVIGSTTILLFRFWPGLESRYFESDLMPYLLGERISATISTEWFNVLEPFKSGGLFFHNANRASLVSAVLALLYLALWLQYRKRMTFLLFLLCLAATAAAGSKTALLAGAVLFPLVFLLPVLVHPVKHRVLATISYLGIALLAASALFIGARLTGGVEGADLAVSQRGSLFRAAAKYFSESPFLGLGFGGWAEHWGPDAASFGLNRPELPPHNFVILEWANAGIIAALLSLLILGKLLFDYLRFVRNANTLPIAFRYAAQFCAIAWISAHGMFDNTFFYGSPNLIPIFAMLVARAATTTRRSKGIDNNSRPVAPARPQDQYTKRFDDQPT